MKPLSPEKIEAIVNEVWRMSSYVDGDENKEVAQEAQRYALEQAEEVIDEALLDFSAEKREKGHPASYWEGYHYARDLIRHHWQEFKKQAEVK